MSSTNSNPFINPTSLLAAGSCRFRGSKARMLAEIRRWFIEQERLLKADHPETISPASRWPDTVQELMEREAERSRTAGMSKSAEPSFDHLGPPAAYLLTYYRRSTQRVDAVPFRVHIVPTSVLGWEGRSFALHFWGLPALKPCRVVMVWPTFFGYLDVDDPVVQPGHTSQPYGRPVRDMDHARAILARLSETMRAYDETAWRTGSVWPYPSVPRRSVARCVCVLSGAPILGLHTDGEGRATIEIFDHKDVGPPTVHLPNGTIFWIVQNDVSDE